MNFCKNDSFLLEVFNYLNSVTSRSIGQNGSHNTRYSRCKLAVKMLIVQWSKWNFVLALALGCSLRIGIVYFD